MTRRPHTDIDRGRTPLTTEPRPRRLPPAVRHTHARRPELDRATVTGELDQVRTSVFVPAHVAEDPARQRVAEVLGRMRGVAERLSTEWWFSHSSAALAWGCWTWRLAPEVHITQLHNPQIRKEADPLLLRHWTKSLPERDRAEISGVPVTSLERTVVDCARALREPQALVIADSALRLGADWNLVGKILRESAGKRGVRRAREVVALADGRSESPGETLVRWIAYSNGLPELDLAIKVSTRLGDFLIDLGWPDLKIGIEFDGAVKYSGGEYGDPERVLEAQLRRQDALVAAGWVIIRVTWEELEEPHTLALRLDRARHEVDMRRRAVV